MDQFLSLLKATSASDPTKIVSGLHSLYVGITDLNDDGLVAAYQAIMTLKESSSVPEHALFKRIRQAIVDQMQQEIYKYGPDPDLRRELHERFQRITGEVLCWER